MQFSDIYAFYNKYTYYVWLEYVLGYSHVITVAQINRFLIVFRLEAFFCKHSSLDRKSTNLIYWFFYVCNQKKVNYVSVFFLCVLTKHAHSLFKQPATVLQNGPFV